MSYPPPPGSEEPHYTPIYAAPPPANPPPPLPPPPPQSQSQSQSQSRSQADDNDTGNPNGAGPPPRMYPQDMFPKMDGLGDMLQQQAQHASHALNNDHDHAHAHAHAAVHVHTPVHTPVQPAPPHGQTASPADPNHHHNKTNRLRKACDSCSIRKVKCDESGPPCRACAALDIPCTFERPSRRRGPPNRHAEAIKKRRRLEGGDLGSGASNPASPTNAAHALAQLSSLSPQLSAESICPLPTMNALIDDFFTYIHPLCPFPHEPSFREAWETREDTRNPSFLALLASMIAAMVASFPRRPRLHIKQQSRDLYPSHLSLVDKCREVCAQARGPGYLDKPSLNVYDACTSYFLGLVGGYTFQWRQMRLYIGECLTILRSLGLHKAQEQRYTPLDSLLGPAESNEPNFAGSRDLRLDKITEQIGRRVFWTAFAGARTTQQLGASFGELTILPSTPTEALPPLPLEVDDACIFPNEIMAQPLGIVPEITGFNINTRVYLSYDALTTCEMAFGCDELFDWDQQQRMLESCLHRCKSVLDNIPDVLRVQPQGLRQRRQPYYPPIPEYLNMREPGMAVNGPDSPEARRAIQYEIQKANIYASHLSIRSHLVEKYFTLLEKSTKARAQMARQSSPIAPPSGLDRLISSTHVDAEALEKQMSEEREQVFKDLLVVLGSIDMVNMEPNGDSLTQKIRSIARTLLEVPKERRGSVAQQHQDYLYKFLDILGKLERVNPEGSDPSMGPVDEEAELRHWADLREYQLKFQEQGGVYSYS